MTSRETGESLGVGLILGESFKVLGHNLLPFVATATVIVSPVYLFLFWAVWEEDFLVSVDAWQFETGLTVAEILLGFVTHAAVVYGTFQQLRGKRTGLTENMATGLKGVVAGLLVAITSGVLVTIGLALLVVPGLVLATMYWVAVPAAVVEKTSVGGGLGRSADLTAGYRWPVFGLILIFSIGQSLFEKLVDTAFDFEQNYYASLAVVWVLSAAITAFGAVVSTVTYYRLRRIKEGIDIDEIASVFD